MKRKGKITFWNDAKGYGFISPITEEQRVFVHIKAFGKSYRRPVVGDVVTYSTATDQRGRPNAENVSIAGVKRPQKPVRSSNFFPFTMAAGFLLIVVISVLLSAVPMPVLPLYLIVSVATFIAYLLDKSAAKRGAWRTSEGTLHLLALAGGWPGALVAQSLLRHKSKKQSFRGVFWVTVVFNCAVFAWLLTPSGDAFLHSILAAVA